MFNNLKILYNQGKQYIPDVRTTDVPGIFKGRPVISTEKVDVNALMSLCPAGAILNNINNGQPSTNNEQLSTNDYQQISIDLGKCTFCGECAFAFPHKIKFTKDFKISANHREDLIIQEGIDKPVKLRADLIRKDIQKYFKGSLKLRQVSAGGDNSCEMELNACSNVNFDMGRFGIEFVASPRHADGIVITGPITSNMAEPLQICYDATPDPKIIILVGTDAISGGVFADSNTIDRSFLDKYKVDLFIPGNPVHPLAFINGILDLIGAK